MRRYLALSRSLIYSALFAVPLLLLYEAGALWLARSGSSGLRNGADVLLRTLLAAGGLGGTTALTLLLLGGAALLVVVDRRRHRVRLEGRVFLGMLAESTLLALVFGVVVGTATRLVLDAVLPRLAADNGILGILPLHEGIVLSLGAGVYEELVFRVLLVGGLLAALRGGGIHRSTARPVAAIAAALAFSAFHYVGPYADPWALGSFTFRFIAGLAFSALFLARGFGITAWTHALYDVFLLLGRGI
ncbi:MAG: CPBP family glutamic-type intramembrane protease [Gemmatimonadota bacterium]|nr:CPBP family glutamic-type intramembrane protease [Gemmatimonadota bacterium]